MSCCNLTRNRNIYVQNLSVQKSRPHLCAGEPTKPWIMSQEYHSFMFLGPLWSTTDRNTKLTAHTASYSHSAHKTMSSPLWQTKDPASGPLFRPVNAVNRSILYSLKIHFNIILLSMHLCCHKSYLPLPAFILCQMSRQTLKLSLVYNMKACEGMDVQLHSFWTRWKPVVSFTLPPFQPHQLPVN